MKHYEPPKPNEPHAVVKVRRSYASHSGVTLDEVANLGEYRVMSESRAAELDDTQTTAVLVHPGNSYWEITSVFSHTESRQVQEQYSVQVPYTATESYSCGTGTSYQSCTRSVTRYRSDTRWRTVTRNVSVTDAACTQRIAHLAEVGHTYLLQYSYTGHEVCSLQCMEQIARPDGGFDTSPCRPPLPQ